MRRTCSQADGTSAAPHPPSLPPTQTQRAPAFPRQPSLPPSCPSEKSKQHAGRGRARRSSLVGSKLGWSGGRRGGREETTGRRRGGTRGRNAAFGDIISGSFVFFWGGGVQRRDLHPPVTVDAPEARQDVPEAGVAVQLGLALGALDGALQPPAEEALRGGRDGGGGHKASPKSPVCVCVCEQDNIEMLPSRSESNLPRTSLRAG